MKVSILATRSLTDVNDSRRIALFVIRAKKRSTWLSQEARTFYAQIEVRFGRPGCAQDRPTCSPIKGSSACVSTIRSAIVVRQRFFGIFGPLFMADSERLRDNRRMTETTAHNQH